MGDLLVRTEVRDRVAVLTLDRPPANSLGSPLLDALSTALDRLDGGVRVLVVASAVPAFFAAGADIRQLGAIDAAGFHTYGEQLRAVLERLAADHRPSVAAIEGRALGGGLELALACSLRVGSADAVLGLPEPRLGLIAGAGGTQRLTHIVGRGRALDIMLTARDVGADEAYRIGLLDRLTPAGGALAAAEALAGDMCALSAPALTAVLRCVDDTASLPLAAALRAEADRIEALFAGQDAAEGIAAFLAKRPPRFD